MDINNFEKICIVGWARSGVSLCNLLLSLNRKILVSEIKKRDCFSSSLIDEFRQKGVSFEFGVNSREFIKNCQLVILSPGVNAINSSIIKTVFSLGIPYIGEIEFSYWLNKAKIIAITGTNGKTTTAFLTEQVLKEAQDSGLLGRKKRQIYLGGNIGTPFSSFVLDTKEDDIVVLEISSFQLETILEFRPDVAVFLNIEPDHLDRYGDLGGYLQAKINIFKNQKSCDWALINRSINFRADIEKKIKSQIKYFSDEFPNENFSCAYKIARIFGVDKTECLKVFSSFKGFPHRLQKVREINGIAFINDSKATNPFSTIWALKNTKTPIILIGGGKDKGLDYSVIIPYLRKVKKINLYGEASSKIKGSLKANIESEIFSFLDQALVSAYKQAKPGDTVLFSPMCASFDQFGDYEERGNRFMKLVNDL